jgi:hypothetical protein
MGAMAVSRRDTRQRKSAHRIGFRATCLKEEASCAIFGSPEEKPLLTVVKTIESYFSFQVQ